MRETIELQVTATERELLREMTARPEQEGASWGPLRIEQVYDVVEERDRWTVQVEVSSSGGVDVRRTLDDLLRQRLAHTQKTPDPKTIQDQKASPRRREDD